MDDLRSQLRFRGLESGGYQQTPLVEFIGDLADIEVKINDKFGGTDAIFKFSGIQVLASTSPYDFATAEISLRLQNAKGMTDRRGRYGILAGSIAKFMPDDLLPEDEGGWVIGKRLHLKQTPGHMLYSAKANSGKGGEEPGDAWECIGIQGAVVASAAGAAPKPQMTAIEAAIRLIAGKTDAEYSMAAVRDPQIKGSNKVIQMILTKSLVPSLLSTGIVTKNTDGKYELVADDDAIRAVAEAML